MNYFYFFSKKEWKVEPKRMELPSSKDFLSNIAYDCVIFGFAEEQLKILVLEYHNTGWFALPGGFVKKKENLEEAVKKGLEERTSLEEIYLEQFHTFGNLSRSNSEAMKKILEQNGIIPPANHWLLDRFISVAYYALINYKNVHPKPDALSDSINWYAIDELPPLMFEHDKIVEKALVTLRANLYRKLVGANLLPTKFTMKELQKVYEAILGETLRRTTFQRKMLSLDILERHEKQFSGKAHKAPYLYSFKG